MSEFKIITFYEFRVISRDELVTYRARFREIMLENSIKGTIILAEEGFNGSVAGRSENIARFISAAEAIIETKLEYKSSVHSLAPFRRIDVKIKHEIVTLKKEVDISKGKNTHVSPSEWNQLIKDPETIVLDARNSYEFKTGTFIGAVDPAIEKFSELPEFVEKNLDPNTHRRVAMFCTGGIRCEKFAPYLKELGFSEVYQLRGGILKYLEEMPFEESLWHGECFVFDDRVSVNESLKKGESTDLSRIKE